MRTIAHDDEVGATGSSHALAGADELISDLAALLDAGLVVVHEHVLGPARYGVAPVRDHHHAEDRRVRRSCTGIMQG